MIALVFCWAGPAYAQPPNVLLILTDDQRWDTVVGMPAVQALAAEGVTFEQSFVPTALCCPSRSGLLTGKYAHHTGVLTNLPPHGGAPTFDASVTLATALHAAGYATGYFGKYLNAYDRLSPAIPPGWDVWQVFVGDTDLYFNYRLNEDGIERDHGATPEEYSTDLLRDRVAAFIKAPRATPWFAVYAPFAPHAGAIPAPRHAGRYAGIAPWRPRSYGEIDVSDKPAYWSGLSSSWQASTTTSTDVLRQDQLETLLAVDEAVATLMTTLRTSGVADQTVVIYTSDNGLAWGEHWMSGRKRCGYDECLRVPLVIRDPQTLRYREKRRLVLNLDLAPTIADLAGVALPDADGQSLLPLLRSRNRSRHGIAWRADFLTEGWNFPDEPSLSQPPAYAGVRSERWKYLRTDTPSGVMEELYDLRRDRFELEGAAQTPRETTATAAMRARLVELLR